MFVSPLYTLNRKIPKDIQNIILSFLPHPYSEIRSFYDECIRVHIHDCIVRYLSIFSKFVTEEDESIFSSLVQWQYNLHFIYSSPFIINKIQYILRFFQKCNIKKLNKIFHHVYLEELRLKVPYIDV